MTKENWDYEKYIRDYNKIVLNCGGWIYEKKRSEQKLKEMYELSGDSSIEQFAENVFIYEQRT